MKAVISKTFMYYVNFGIFGIPLVYLISNHTIALNSNNYRGGVIIAFQRTRNFGKRSSSYEMRSILVEVVIFLCAKNIPNILKLYTKIDLVHKGFKITAFI